MGLKCRFQVVPRPRPIHIPILVHLLIIAASSLGAPPVSSLQPQNAVHRETIELDHDGRVLPNVIEINEPTLPSGFYNKPYTVILHLLGHQNHEPFLFFLNAILSILFYDTFIISIDDKEEKTCIPLIHPPEIGLQALDSDVPFFRT
ncbi:hypothetical protein C8J56DRAFT_1163850 [Mycena floridula]|nr:hypothetical protein C8J56DRAFT_1163850 [Mycena floridula]